MVCLIPGGNELPQGCYRCPFTGHMGERAVHGRIVVCSESLLRYADRADPEQKKVAQRNRENNLVLGSKDNHAAG